MQMTAVYGCVRIMAEATSGLRCYTSTGIRTVACLFLGTAFSLKWRPEHRPIE